MTPFISFAVILGVGSTEDILFTEVASIACTVPTVGGVTSGLTALTVFAAGEVPAFGFDRVGLDRLLAGSSQHFALAWPHLLHFGKSQKEHLAVVWKRLLHFAHLAVLGLPAVTAWTLLGLCL